MSVRSPALAFGALAVGSVIVVDPSGLSPFGPAKWLVVSTVAPALAALSLRRPSTRCHRQSWWAWVALLVLLTASALVNGDARVALLGHPDRHLGVITWVLLLAMFCAGQQLADQLTTLCRAAVVAAASLGLYSLWELLFGRPIAVSTTTRRLLGPFGSAAFLGAACCLLGPVALGVALDRLENKSWRRVAGIAAWLVAVALIGSGTRGSWIGMTVAAIVWIVAARPGKRTVMWCAAGLLVAVCAVAPRLGDVSSRRDNGSRLGEWRVAMRVIERHPLLGVGPEGYRIAVAEGVDDAYERAHRRDTVLPDRAHSAVLDVTLAGGIGAGLLYLGIIGFVGRRAWRLLQTGAAARVGIGLAVIAYGVQQLLLFPLAELDPIWWVFAGVVATLTSTGERTETRSVVAPLLAGLASVASVVMLVAGVLDVAGDRLARTALRAGDSQRAIDAADRAVSLRPDNMRYRLVAAEVRLDRGTLADIDAATGEARRATDWSSDDPFATDELATTLSQRAAATGDSTDITTALAQWKRLVERDPHRASWQLQLGRAAALAGDAALARQSWTIAAALGEPGAAALLDALDGSS
jgi:O-antigen ligase